MNDKHMTIDEKQNPVKSSNTSLVTPNLPGTKVWMYSVRAAIPNPWTKQIGMEKNQCLCLKNNKKVRLEQIPKNKNAPK